MKKISNIVLGSSTGNEAQQITRKKKKMLRAFIGRKFGYTRQYQLANLVFLVVAFPNNLTILAFWMRWPPNFHGSLNDFVFLFV